MTQPRKNAATTRGKPFEHGNPGRPRGSRHRITLACEVLLEGQHEALTKKAIEKALEGDMVALRLCLDRIAPARKDAPVSLEMPVVRSLEDAVEASVVVMAAVGVGDITPDEAGRIMALLSAHKTIVEVGSLERRLAALEEERNAS
jgi:multidrug efflux pump subunit AcrA (membrane-fusion protein)